MNTVNHPLNFLGPVTVKEVIITTIARRGDGKTDPIRVLTEFWDKDGSKLAEHDPLLDDLAGRFCCAAAKIQHDRKQMEQRDDTINTLSVDGHATSEQKKELETRVEVLSKERLDLSKLLREETQDHERTKDELKDARETFDALAEKYRLYESSMGTLESKLNDDVKRLTDAIRWALGEDDKDTVPTFSEVMRNAQPIAKYAWRKELRRRAGL